MTRGVPTITPNTIAFLLGQAWSAIRRNGLLTLASVANIAVSLAVLGGMFLVSLNLQHMARAEARKAVITVDLKPGAKSADVEASIWKDPRVKDTQPVSAEESLRAIFAHYVPNPKAIAYMDKNPLPDSIRVQPALPEQIDAVAADLAKLPGVAKVRYGKEVVTKILMLARTIRASGLALLALMGFAMVLIVNTTIRLTIYARRREIRIMQLVGATNGFIRIPFLCEGLFHGLAGGIFAASLCLLGYLEILRYVDTNLAFIQLLYSPKLLVSFALAMVLAGVLAGGTGSVLSLKRYLRAA
jgi:cell division transport system permease protein